MYGIPLTILKWIHEGLGYGEVSPAVAFHVLRIVMFALSFVLEDWAIHELLPSPRDRRIATTLIASSYVTWTIQTHTFSNGIETLIALWCIVLITRIKDDQDSTQVVACMALAFLCVLGVFNRITFPAFLILPGLQLLPSLIRRPLRLVIITSSALVFLTYAVVLDTHFYASITSPIHIRDLPDIAIFTPWNNLKYNLDPSNLASHGLHPYYQHFAANLPQLLGPAVALLPFTSHRNTLFWTGITGTAALSCFQHQEARFLLPAVPLLLASLRMPRRFSRIFVAIWIFFNVLAGIVFGVYHQGGVVPTQSWIAKREDVTQVFWWKTYSPPRWLLNGRNANITTTDLMGMPGSDLITTLMSSVSCASSHHNQTLLVAPASATFLDPYTKRTSPGAGKQDLVFKELWRYRNHIGLDDLDFGDDGVWPTLERVIGRRGLVAWEVHKAC